VAITSHRHTGAKPDNTAVRLTQAAEHPALRPTTRSRARPAAWSTTTALSHPVRQRL
jgi:hypothetical protein